MKNVKNKFKKGDVGYHFNGSTTPNNLQAAIGSITIVSAWLVNIIECKGSKVKGFIWHNFSEVQHWKLLDIQQMCYDKITEKTVKNMKPSDRIKFKFDGNIKNILTKEEMKAEMIKWIANDFDDPSDKDY